MKKWITLTFCVLLQPSITNGELFNYQLSGTTPSQVLNYTDNVSLCKSKGYDGLALVKSPEQYTTAVRILAPLLTDTLYHSGFYIGLIYNADAHIIEWKDGTPAGVDKEMPSRNLFRPMASRPYGRLSLKFEFTMDQGSHQRLALCGNDKNLPTQAIGLTRMSSEPVPITKSHVLSEIRSPSYLECVVQCGADYRCRVAAFDTELQTCTTYGPGTMSIQPHPMIISFFRNGY